MDREDRPQPVTIAVEHTRQRQPEVSCAATDQDDDVLRMLAPLTPAYVRRAAPGEVAHTPVATLVAHAVGPIEGFTPCEVEAVVTIDPDRRVLWPHDGASGERSVASIRAVHHAIEVTVGGRPGAYARRLDQRGRLRLPRGVLRAAGLAAGDRVVVARTPGRWLLVPADRVGIRVPA